MREKIREAALELFDKYGFYHTGIRDIASKAECSLPTLYYHYQSKELLFDKVVCDSFEQLSQSIDEQIPEGLPMMETFYYMVMQRRMLAPFEKLVFRIAIKVQLGFDGSEQTQLRVKKWVDLFYTDTEKRLMEEFGNRIFSRLALRVLDQMLQRTALGEEELTEADIEEELKMFFSLRPDTVRPE
ncbi:hypothetical protein FACS1894171_1760 [Clostridia bacterium]|nr:hypothetical protein FACS1894171_1760 [Clostridia bacterium]